MFAHQVIDSLKTFNEFAFKDGLVENFIEKIVVSQKFHFGNMGPISNLFPVYEGLDFRPLKLPYDMCWIDYIFPKSFPQDSRNAYKERSIMIPKRGILAVQHPESINVDIFNYTTFDDRWRPGWFHYEITNQVMDMLYANRESLNVPIYETYDVYKKKIKNSVTSVVRSNCIYPTSELMACGATNRDMEDLRLGDSVDLSVLYLFLMFLSCKNIGIETVPAPVKLNNKRKKAGKQPLFSYKTLVIKPTTKKQQSIPKHLWETRIHLARGHFKTYTKESPLFGKIVGRFWWQPQVRGRNREGIVMKDYRVEATNDQLRLHQSPQ